MDGRPLARAKRKLSRRMASAIDEQQPMDSSRPLLFGAGIECMTNSTQPFAPTSESPVFGDVEPGQGAKIGDRLYAKIEPDCDFARCLPSPFSYGVQIGTGILTFIGPDTACELVSWDRPRISL